MVPEIVEGHPLIQWLILRGKVSVLKQFETVELTVQNLSPEPFKLIHGSAKLNLPEGLSLAPTAKPQSFTQAVPDIPGSGETAGGATTTWVIRGDTPGSYRFSAQYNGQFDKIEVPIELQASLAEPLRIWGKEALSLSVAGDEGSLATGRPYHVVISVTNVAPIPLYNLNLSVDSKVHANFVFQPGERFNDSIGELPAEKTLESHKYIVLPDAPSVDVFNPELSSIAFDGEERHAGQKVSELTPPALYAIEALSDTAGKVHLHWQSVPDAEGYEVFYTPNLDTAEEWTAVEASETSGATPSTQPLAKGATNAYLLPSGPGFYAVSSVTKDHMIETLLP